MPEDRIIGKPSYALIQRASLSANATIAAPIGASTQVLPLVLATIQATQALRLLSVFGRAGDTGTGNITQRGAQIQLAGGSSGNALRAWSGYYAGILLGNAGIAINITDDEIINGNDYAEQGSVGGNAIELDFSIDVTVAAAISNLFIEMEALFEIYAVSMVAPGRGGVFTESGLAAQGVPANLIK
jgi:hypothetical protein